MIKYVIGIFAFILFISITIFTITHRHMEVDINQSKDYVRGFKDGKYYCEVMNARQNNSGFQ